MIAMWAISEVISLTVTTIDEFIHKSEKAREASSELTDSWSEENSSIDDSISKYKELKERLDNTSLSTEEVKSTKEQLLTIQDSLVEKYGQEALGIDLVNGKYDEQIAKLKELSKEKAEKYVAKNYGNVAEDKNYLTDEVLLTDTFSGGTGSAFKTYSRYFKENGIDLNKYLKKYSTLSTDKSGANLNAIGTREQIIEDLTNFVAEITKDFGENNPAAKKIKETVASMLDYDDLDEESINKSKNNVKKYAEAEILSRDDTRQAYEDATNAVENYNKALESGKGVEEAKKNLDSVKKKVKNTTSDIYGADTVFNDIYKNISETTKKTEDNLKDSKTSKPLSFSKAWSGLEDEAQEKLLELAKAGKLTPDVLSSNEKYADILKSVGDSAEIAAQKINKMVDISDQLSAMKSGISSISSVLAEKKDNLSHKKTKEVGIGADTLAGFDAEIKGLDSWEDFEKKLGNGKTSMEACQKAANKLATEWVNSNNFLSQLNRTNEDYYISTLKEMGVKNAEAVVTNALNQKKAEEAQKEREVALEKKYNEKSSIDLTQADREQIDNLATYVGWSDKTRNALYQLALQKQTANGIKLSTSDDIDQLISLVDAVGGATTALEAWKNYKGGGSTVEARKKYEAAKKEVEKSLKKSKKKVSVDVNPSPTTSGSGSKSTKDKKSKTKESKQEINWISRTLEVLQSKIDLTKAKFENLFSVDSKKNNLNTQISQTTKLLNAQQKAATNYQKKANSVKLSSSLKNKVKNGKITGNLSSLIATYGESTANKITKYQDYIDKAKEATKAVQELKKNLLELKEEKYQLYVDQADGKISALDAQEANATTASSKNKYEQSKFSWIKQSYNYQIKIAQLEKDSTKVAQLRAEKEKEIADSYKVQFDNIKNEYENKVALNESDIATTQAKISALEAQGRRLSTAYYSSMIATTAKDRALLAEEKAKLETSLKNIKTGSDEWYEAKQDIASVAQEIYDCDQNMAEFQKTINELELKPFELITSQLESASNHTQFLIDLLSYKDLTSKDVGGVTKEGMATLSLYFDRMKQNQDMIQNTQNEWNKFTEQLAQGNSGLSEEEIQGAYEEYAQTIRDAIEANEDFKDSVKSLVEEAFNVQLDALNDLIEKRKEALQSEKD